MDPTHEVEVILHLWNLYTSQAPVLDLTNTSVTTTTEFLQAVDNWNLRTDSDKNSTCGSKTSGKEGKPLKTECIPDSDTSDKEQVTNPCFPTMDEERHYGTIPGSALATRAALLCNPTPPSKEVHCTRRPK